jgi:hypothetical protein
VSTTTSRLNPTGPRRPCSSNWRTSSSSLLWSSPWPGWRRRARKRPRLPHRDRTDTRAPPDQPTHQSTRSAFPMSETTRRTPPEGNEHGFTVRAQPYLLLESCIGSATQFRPLLQRSPLLIQEVVEEVVLVEERHVERGRKRSANSRLPGPRQPGHDDESHHGIVRGSDGGRRSSQSWSEVTP